MNQSKVPHKEISVRLSVCCEFLLDEKKSMEDAYESLMNKLGRKLLEFSEFKYWFKRFKNDQFDLGYDTNLDVEENANEEGEVSNMSSAKEDKEPEQIEIQLEEVENVPNVDIEKKKLEMVETVAVIPNKIELQPEEVENFPKEIIEEKQLETEKVAAISKEITPNVDTVESVPIQIDHNKIDYQYNVQNVPLIFQNLLREKMDSFDRIHLFNGLSFFLLEFDDIRIRINRYWNLKLSPYEKELEEWAIEYNNTETVTVATTDPEKLIIDHLLFVLLGQNWQINKFAVQDFHFTGNRLIDFGRVLISTLDSFDLPLSVSSFDFKRLNEDLFISLLKRLDPNSLKEISFEIGWKTEGDYRKMEEIFDLVQWKQAKTIKSMGDTALNIDSLLQYENIVLMCDKITPEDVFRVRNRFWTSSSIKSCTLSIPAWKEGMNVHQIERALLSEYLHSKLMRNSSYQGIYFYRLLFEKSFLKVILMEREIIFTKVSKCS